MSRLALIAVLLLTVVAEAPAAEDPLPEGAILRLGSPRFRHPEATIALSADGKQLITCSVTTKSIRVCEAATGKLVRELAIDATGYLVAIAWAPDDRTFVTAETVPGNQEKPYEHFLRIHNAETGKVIRSIPYPLGNYRGHTPIRYLGRGKEIAAQTEGGIGIWELETGVELIQNKFRQGNYSEFGASADGKRIAVVGGNYSGEVFVWDWEEGKEPQTLKTDSKGRPQSVIVSPDGKQLALLDDMGGPIRLIDPNNGKLLREFRLPDRKRMLAHAVFTPDGKKLLANDDGGHSFLHNEIKPGGVVVWDVATGQIEKRIEVAAGLSDVAISANGKFVASPAIGFPIWEISSGKQINPLSETELAVTNWAIAHGSFILTLADSQPARLWDEKSGRILHTFAHMGQTRAGAISPDGTRAATSGDDDLIKVWDTATGKLLMKVPGHGDRNGTTALRFSDDGRKLISFGTDYFVRVTDLATGKAVRESPVRVAGLSFPGETSSRPRDVVESTFTAVSAALSFDGSRLCLAANTKCHVFDTNTGNEVVSLDFRLNWGFTRPVFSPDGTKLLIVGRGKIIETSIKGGGFRDEHAKEKPLVCWDATTGRKLWEVMLRMGYTQRLAYAPDGRMFAVQSRDSDKVNPVEFRDAATGNLLGRLDKLPMNALDVAFTSDSKRIVLVTVDGTVLLYNVPDFKK